MKHWILMPDSFKGTMSSTEICSIMKQAILQHYPDAQIDAIPVADGGEGSVDCFLEAVGGERVTVTVSGPFGEPMESYYGIISGQVAVIRCV